MNLEVRGAPSYYACEVGVFHRLEELFISNHMDHCVVIHGDKSWEAVSPFFPIKPKQISFTYVTYNGECTLEEVKRIEKIALHKGAKAIVGIGGGKVLDLAKAVGNKTNLEVALIPTLASTCAAWTPLSVFYDETGSFTHYTVFPKSTLYVLIEPRVILNSPCHYLVAGIADTLAKWYEADVLIRELMDPPLVVQIAHQSAKFCKDLLLEHSIQAVHDFKASTLSPALLKVIETIIVAGGMVGGFGDQFGRIAGAHAVHNGLTTNDDTHHLLHGEKVAYGILVQLALEKNWNEIRNILPFYRQIKLPYLLEHLHLLNEDQHALKKISEAIASPNESIHLMKGTFTSETIYQAIIDLENFVQSNGSKKLL